MRQFSRLTAILLAATAVLSFAAQSFAQNVSLDPSGRYYRNSSGQPLFLLGYYDWAAVPNGYFIDHPSQYLQMMQQGSPYKINYIRISLGVNRMTASTNPPSWNGVPTPVPFVYNGSNKADLNQWDNTFWTGLQNQCSAGQANGVIVHVAFFDGVELRSQGGAAYGYNNSFWNANNHAASYYPNMDYSDNTGAFYRLNEFNTNTGIGFYQRSLISKTITTLASYNNVFYEVGNELISSDAAWYNAVIAYIKSLTPCPVTQCGGGGGSQLSSDGFSDHVADTPAEAKSIIAGFVGHGHPGWIDPDGSALGTSGSDDNRRAAWYSFAGGAGVYGGFSTDFWEWPVNPPPGFNTTRGNYYKYLEDFVQTAGAPFQNMVPHHELISNGSTANSCIANIGTDYVVYVLNNASVTVDLTTMTGSANWRTYDPRTGVFSGFQSVAGGAVQNFNKPGGADDWVVQITGGGGEVLNWNTLGNTVDLGVGSVPAVATDAQGNIHVIFVSGNTVQYRKYSSAFGLLTSESINAPSGAYYPHIMCDANSVPHITYTNGTVDYANNCYYTNRIGGTWKSPITAFSVSGADALWYPRIGLWSTFAYIGCQRGASGALVGQIVRVTNLSTTPSVDASVQTQMRSGISVDGNGFVHAVGRNGGAGTFYQKYNSNLSTAGNFVDLGFGYPGGGQTAWSDGGNVTHLVAWSRQANAGFPCNDRCGMDYNNTGRQNPDQSFQSPIQGLLGGAAGTGPDGNEVSGWWNDDVAPVITKDALGVVYVAWREWTSAGLGQITKVDNSAFTQTCITDPNCGGNNCTGTPFSGGITRRRWWNCEICPAQTRGVYVAFETGGHAYVRPVGVSVAAPPSSPGTLNVKPAGTITVDGSSSDWVLGDFVTKSRGGEGTTGDIALVGFDGGSTVYRGAYAGVLPTNAADHTAKVYSRQNSTYLYFLIRSDDNQIQTQNPVGSNWANDCVEFYIDPTNDGGSTAMSNSTSDIQLVIDAANQKNVYSTTGGYATQVLAGVTSAVTTDGSGWWLEVRITKTALDGDIPANGGKFGLDFNFRDNDNNNDPALTTVYTWSESSTAGFPSKIPDHWGDGVMRGPFGGTARPIPGIVQAEDFDNGGEGVAYHDTDTPNNGGQYRTTEGVDIEATTDTGGGFDVGWVATSEWMEYTVNVNTTGDYAIKMRMSSAGGGGSFHLSLNGVALTSIKPMADTGGWQNWTTIIVPGIFMAAGNNKVLRFTVDSGAYNFNYMDFAFSGVDVVSVDMGSPNIDDGMTQVSCCDGNTVLSTLGGHYSQNNADIPDHYMYFTVTDIYAFQGNKNNATITFDYYDKDTGTLSLQYDGTSNAYTAGPSVALVNSLTWKTAVWTVGDAYFGNRENGLADFRIFYSGVDFYIDTVTVFATVGTPPPGAASNPSPANGATGVAITGTTLSWTAGSGATNRDVCFGTANPPPFIQNQTATTYSPGTLAAGTTYFWRIDEKNTGGTTTGTVWSFTTLPLPGLASGPNPANGATLVAITTDPSWTAGSNATSHDVLFGTVNPPPFVINQTSTTYAAPTLTPNTLYYWRIDEKNGSGTTTGTVWSFTTLPLPGAASAPNPASGATLVAITTDPSWTAGSNAASHDVRFGTVNPPPFVVNQTGTTYAAPTLNPNTLYYWRIDEINTSGTTTGTVWSFTTLPLPGLASAPNPANAATGVSITAALSWTAGSNATSHNVRYGTTNPPPFIQNQAGTSYTPPTKAPNTVYFWRIDEQNSSGTTTGTVWSFTTLPLPGLATAPNPANAATGVSITPTLSWTAGSNATSHNVRFGTANPPPLIQNQAGTTYAPSTLLNNTVYFWRIDEQNGSGTTTGTVWSFTTAAAGPPILNVKNVTSALTINGSSSDWNLAAFVTKIRGGELGNGDIALVGFDGGSTVYRGAFAGVLPTNAADHTAKVYSRHDSTYLYFLIRCDDNQIQTQNGVAMNWANDCVEFYIDPTNNGGATAMSNSTSDIQLVIDALNQKNVYMTTAGYATQVLAGVTSAVTTDGTGWWCEVRIQKSVLDGDIPANGTIGIDFNFRDNDNNNDAALTTVYTWAETSAAGFPSKIPDHWGDAGLPVLPAPGLATSPSPASGATGIAASGTTLSWTAGLDATSHDVRFGTANPPPFVVNQAGTTYNTGALSGSTTYFWRIDEKNGTGTTTGTVWSFTTAATGPVTLNNSAFPSNADGWNIVVWRAFSGYSDGTMAWASTNGNPSGNMASTGSGATDNTDRCTREGGEINKGVSTSGYNTLVQVVYDLRFDTNQSGGTCTGSCGGAELEGDCADKIAMYYSTAGTAGPWTLLETVNASAVTQGVWNTRTINCPAAANNKPNFAVRMRFQFNTTTDTGRLDNVKVIATP